MSYDGSNSTGRPPIPMELRRRVLVEAGHHCAIPTCRHIEVDIHHIVPWARCESHEYENLIALCPNCHRRADRNEIDRKSLKLYKLNLRFAHDRFSQLEMDMLFDLHLRPTEKGTPWLPFMLIFFKRIIEAGYVEIFQEGAGYFLIDGVRNDPAYLSLTKKGQAFLDSLGLQEL